jgi:PAS domain S-box-containing protein
MKSCQNENFFIKSILSAIHVPVILTDLNGKILFANHAVNNKFGFLPEEITGKDLSILLTPEDQGIFYQNLLCLCSKKSFFEGEIMLVRKDATIFLSYFTAKACADPNYDCTLVICIEDIHELKQLEKERRVNSYEDLRQIASGIAHEIRNPLVGIGGFLNRLYKSCNAFDGHVKYYEFIIENLKKIEGLIEKVEYFSKLPEPDFSKEQLWELIDKALQPYLPEMDERNIELTIQKSDTSLHLDAVLFIKVISILIANAMDALEKGGKISLKGEEQDNQYIIHIADSGSGISQENMPFIFNPFFSTKAHGAGIDLAIVKRIMENHSGTVRVESELDKGTTFSLVFPLERRRSIRVKLINEP